MKKDRNCGATPYPIYPPYQGMNMINPYNMNMMPMNMMPMNTMNGYQNNSVDQFSILEQQLNNLESRVSSIESIINNSSSYSNTKYNSSNYQMM